MQGHDQIKKSICRLVFVFFAAAILVTCTSDNISKEQLRIYHDGQWESVRQWLDDEQWTDQAAFLLKREEEILYRMESGESKSDILIDLASVYLDLHLHTRIISNEKILLDLARLLFTLALQDNPSSLHAILGKEYKKGEIDPRNVKRMYDQVKNFELGTGEYGLQEDLLSKMISISFLYGTAFEQYSSEAMVERGLELAEEAIRRDSKSSSAYMNKANILYRLGEFAEAQKPAEKAVLLSQGESKVEKNLLGLIHMELGNTGQAKSVLEDASVDNSGEPYACAFQSLGELYRRTGKLKESARMYREAADASFGDSARAFEAAIPSFEAGEYEMAELYLKRALAIEKKLRFEVLQGFLYLFNRKYDQAEKLFLKLQEAQPSNPGPAIGLGHLAIIRKQYEKARQLLAPYTTAGTDFNFKMACLGMGWYHANQNDHLLALHYFNKILMVRPNHILALLGKGNSLLGLARMTEAEDIYNKVLALQPGNPYALAELAVLKLSQGEEKLAEKTFHEALSKDMENYTCPYEGLGMLYLKQGKLGKAKKSFKKAIEINPDIEYKKYNGLAKIYIREGKYEEAKVLLKKSMENFPNDDEAKNLLAQIENSNEELGSE